MYRKGNKNTEKVENVCLQGSWKFWLQLDTKSIGRMGWWEAQLLVEQAPLMHWI